jgi:DNA polymerase (family 10)
MFRIQYKELYTVLELIFDMKLDDSQKLAQEIIEQIRPYCEQIEVAGSVRRKKSEVKDIDLVLIPKQLLWHRIIATLQRTMDAKPEKRGDMYAQLTIKGVSVDLYVATPETLGALLLIRTGSAEHNIRLSKRALSIGMKLTHRGLAKDGKIIASTEEDIFEALGLSYIEPEKRE